MASGKVPIFVINLDAVTDSKLGVGFEEWEKEKERIRGGRSTEIGKKAWLFAKLQPGRARKTINAT